MDFSVVIEKARIAQFECLVGTLEVSISTDKERYSGNLVNRVNIKGMLPAGEHAVTLFVASTR